MKSSTIWPVSWKTIRYSRPKRSDTYARANFLKTIPSTAPHTYIARVWQYPPSQGQYSVTSTMSPRERENANPSFHWLKPMVTTIYPVVVTDLSNCSRCNLVLSQNIAQKSIVTECVCLCFILASFSLTYVVLSPLEARLCFPSWRLCKWSSCFSDLTSWSKKVTLETLLVSVDKEKQMNQYICLASTTLASEILKLGFDVNDDMTALLVRR